MFKVGAVTSYTIKLRIVKYFNKLLRHWLSHLVIVFLLVV